MDGNPGRGHPVLAVTRNSAWNSIQDPGTVLPATFHEFTLNHWSKMFRAFHKERLTRFHSVPVHTQQWPHALLPPWQSEKRLSIFQATVIKKQACLLHSLPLYAG